MKYTQKPFKITTTINLKKQYYLLYSVCDVTFKTGNFVDTFPEHSLRVACTFNEYIYMFV